MRRVKANLLKVFPYLFGFALGWLLMNPPECFRALGAARYLVVALLCFGLLVGVLMMLISANLPADLQVTPAPDLPLGDLQPLADQVLALGFAAAGPPLRVGVSPPGIILPYCHDAWATYAMIFKTGTVPAKISYEFVTMLEKDDGSLTSSAAAAADVFPLMPGERRQVFPDATVEALFQQHAAAVTWLHDQGHYRRAVNPETFIPDMKAAFAKKRKHFFSSPLRMTLSVLVNSAAKKVPHRGPLSEQKA